MKKWIFLFSVCLLFLGKTFSQVHLKSGFQASIPYGVTFGLEYVVSPTVGIEVSSTSSYSLDENLQTYSGSSVLINVRYYLAPEIKADDTYYAFYLRPFTGIKVDNNARSFSPFTINQRVFKKRKSGMGIGGMVGRKYNLTRKYFFDFNFGLGLRIGWDAFDDGTVTEQTSVFNSFDIFANVLIGIRL